MWLDVVYNHTAEADDADPYTISFRGIDSKMYYMTDLTQAGVVMGGCGGRTPPSLAALMRTRCAI